MSSREPGVAFLKPAFGASRRERRFSAAWDALASYAERLSLVERAARRLVRERELVVEFTREKRISTPLTELDDALTALHAPEEGDMDQAVTDCETEIKARLLTFLRAKRASTVGQGE